MADHGHFEHNRQSLRVVDYLEHPYPGFRGLNLTRVVRECLAKHTSRYDTPVCEDFDPKLLAPLEGQLVDLCDEIAYTSADLEDALAVGWLTLEQLLGLALWRQAWAVAQAESPDARDIHKRIRACKAVLAAMADDLLATTLANIGEMHIDSPQAARKAPRKAVAFSPAVAPAVREMQDFLMANVYLSGPNADKERRCPAGHHGAFRGLSQGPLAAARAVPGPHRLRRPAPHDLRLHRRNDRPVLPGRIRKTHFTLVIPLPKSANPYMKLPLLAGKWAKTILSYWF